MAAIEKKKIVSIGTMIILIVFLLIQFIPSSLPHKNPPVTGEPQWNSAETRSTFFKACADCHSNETVFPWYSTIAPVSWLVESDVRSGRKHFNISEWDQQEQKGDEAAEEVRHGSMPTGLYVLMHPQANLNAVEKKKFVEGLTATFGDSEHKRNEIKFE
ncbi:MAG: heme-binding domain-containing protein [Bacteroidota bacterium]|nr:heme-binding domain-containing protein [Bacteroidota bacterium]